MGMRASIFVPALVWVLLFAPLSAMAQPSYRILVLHSYAVDFQWTEELHQGITDVLGSVSPASYFRVEFMDTKNFFTPDYLDALARIYADKYARAALDGIVVTDNNALEFIQRHGAEIFPQVPVVACGINDAQPPSPGSQIKSILAEESDHLGTFRQALQFRPQLENLYVLYDTTPSGRYIAAEVAQAVAGLEQPVHVEFITDKSLAELKPFVATRKATDAAYLLPFFRDASGAAFSQGQVARELAAVSTVPILASWSFQLGTGVIGGHVISPRHLGELAMRTLVQILQGQPVKPFQTELSVFENRYDYAVVQQYAVDERLLPADTLFINRPLGFYAKHRDVLLPAGMVIAVLAVIAILLVLNLQKHHRLNVANVRLLALDQEVIETQRELVSTLGEVIEVRSQETGNHVKRVAKLSRLIGEKIGLEGHDLEMLEAASPMHDVGKIGIPERILHKLDRLTEEEFDIIKSHTEIGKELLGSSDRELLKTAGIIAYQHHERWDGSGYPNGLEGEQISILARITMLADVYDALSTDRSYKQAWTEERVLHYLRSERGKFFDPYLVDIFLDNLNEVRAIRARYS